MTRFELIGLLRVKIIGRPPRCRSREIASSRRCSRKRRLRFSPDATWGGLFFRAASAAGVRAPSRVPREYYFCQPSACLSAYIFDELVPSRSKDTPEEPISSECEITFGPCTAPTYVHLKPCVCPLYLPIYLAAHFTSTRRNAMSTFVSISWVRPITNLLGVFRRHETNASRPVLSRCIFDKTCANGHLRTLSLSPGRESWNALSYLFFFILSMIHVRYVFSTPSRDP